MTKVVGALGGLLMLAGIALMIADAKLPYGETYALTDQVIERSLYLNGGGLFLIVVGGLALVVVARRDLSRRGRDRSRLE